MPSLAARLTARLIALTPAKREFSDPARIDDRVRRRDADPPRFAPPRALAKQIEVEPEDHDGWPVYRMRPRGQEPRAHGIYAHGGAWIGEIHAVQWKFVARLVAEAGVSITVPIYPLAPHGTAGIIVPRFAGLLDQAAQDYGPSRVFALGDSAGGQIMLSAALARRDIGAAPIAQTVLIAPALDLTLQNPDISVVERTDPWLARAGSRRAIELWRGELALTDRLVSPLLQPLAGIGPLTIFSGTRDITNPDTRLLVAKAQAASVPVTFHEGEGLIHVYPMLWGPEARTARRALVAVLQDIGR